MAENKKSVLLYCDIIHTVEQLDDSDAGLLFKHYLRYINDQNPEPPSKLVQIVFEPIKQNLKRDLKKWENKSVKNSESAHKRWSERIKADANACERIKADANDADKDKDKVIVKVKDKVTVKDIKKNTYTPPTLELVRLYFIENGYSETSANKAYEYYNSANWHDSNGKQVKNWKQKMQGVWFKDENKTTIAIAPTVKIKVPEDFYTQSEYEEYCKKNNLVSQWKPMVW